MRNFFGKIWSVFKYSTKTQKVSFALLLFVLLSMPVGVAATLQPVIFFPKAYSLYPLTPPITPPTTPPITPPWTPRPTSTVQPTRPPYTPPPTKPPYTPPPPTRPPLTPTPWPTPVPGNHRPIIISNTLSVGYVGAKYRSFVWGHDIDVNDKLSMVMRGLPPNLIMGQCNVYPLFKNRNFIMCPVEGIPAKVGVYKVEVMLFDNRGGYDYRILMLNIKQRSPFPPIFR